MRVRWQTAIGEVDAPAIEKLAAGRDRDEHRRVTMLGDANGHGAFRFSSCHVFLFGGAPAAYAVALARNAIIGMRAKRGPKALHDGLFDVPAFTSFPEDA